MKRTHKLFTCNALTLLLLLAAGSATAGGETSDVPEPVRVDSAVGIAQPRQAAAMPAEDPRLVPAPYVRQVDGVEFPGEPLPVVEESTTDEETCVPCQRELVSIDLTSREVIRRTSVSDDVAEQLIGRAGEGDVHAYEELGENPEAPSKDFSQLSHVPVTWYGEYPKQVKLRMSWTDTNGNTRYGSCSGTLIDPKHVVTAGHCVYKHDGEDGNGNSYTVNDFATTVEVVPGYDDGEMPFGNAWAVNLHTYDGWANDESYDYDVGVIDLDRPVGALTGWRGYGNQTNCSDYYTSGTWKHIGYPGEELDGENMYQQWGDYDDACGDVIGYDRSVLKGQSGSGGIRDDAVWAVISHRTCFLECGGRDTRFRSFMVNDMTFWMNGDRPNSADLVAMDVEMYGTYGYAGSTIDGFSFLAHNYSKASYSGSISYEIYLSTDDVISQQDIFLVAGSAPASLGPLGSVRIEHLDVPVHTNVEEGDYYIGVVITTTDSNFSNNDSSGQEAEPITIACVSSPTPYQVNPGDGWECMPTTLTLDWSDAGVGADYQVQVGSYCNVGTTYTSSTSQYTVSGLEGGKVYYWRVRAKTACGSWGNWSPCQSFVTTGAPQPVTATLNPAEDATCQPTALTLTWEEAPLADRYQIMVGTSCGSGNVWTVTGGASLSQRGLTPGTRYHWQVRSGNSCGDWSAWSGCREFSTQDTSVGLPLLLYPAAGQACVQPNTTLDFRDVINADVYDVQLGGACGQGDITSVPTSTLTVSGLTSGTYHWRTRAHACGEVGSWTACQEFTVDESGPVIGGPVTSSTHTIGQWSGANQITMTWAAATDACGVDAYITQFDDHPTTVPTPLYGQETGNLFIESAPLPDGAEYWFHLAARDIPGTEGSPVHVGPFRIDTTAPEDPVAFMPSVPVGGATSESSLTMEWAAAVDQGSGTVGYAALWSTSNNEVPPPVAVTADPSFTASGMSDGTYWFHLRAVDAVGNWSVARHVGPFIVDTVAPLAEIVTPSEGDKLPAGEGVDLEWSFPDDLSGITEVVITYSSNDGYAWYPVVTLESGDPGFPHDPYHWEVPIHSTNNALLRIQATDAAGNVGVATSDAFSILSDVVAGPEHPSITQTHLGSAAPNPFNPRTVIDYSLARPAHVRLDIFDVQGRHVRTLVNDQQAGPAQYQVPWTGTNDRGRAVSSGVYYFRLQAGELQETRRVTLLK
jgi:hypothetical protein